MIDWPWSRRPKPKFDEQLQEDLAEAQIDSRCDPGCTGYMHDNAPGCPWCTATYLMERFDIARKEGA